jgi:conjugative relaxase-like TrwC/TraI family protein
MFTAKRARGGRLARYLKEEERALASERTFTSYQGDEITALHVDEIGLSVDELSFWHGGGAEALGLLGPVSEEAAERLSASLHPDTGETLLENALRGPDKRGHTPGAGVHCVFSPVKDDDVVLLAFPEFRRRIVEDCIAATKKSIDYFEETGGVQSRLGKGGKHVVPAEGVWACFVHFSSRAGQLLIHVHAYLMHPVLTENGWRALHNVEVFARQRELGDYFDAVRARQLASLGFTIEEAPRGYRISGVPDEVRSAMSKGREAIEERLDALGTTHARIAEVVAYEVRDAKRYGTLTEIIERHELENAAIGWPTSRIREAVLAPHHALHHSLAPERDAVQALEEHISREFLPARSETADFDLYPEGALRIPNLREIEVGGLRAAVSRVAIEISQVFEAAFRAWKAIVAAVSARLDPYELKYADSRAMRPYVERETERLLGSEVRQISDRAIERGGRLLYADERAEHEAILKDGRAIRVLDEPDAERRHTRIRALADSLKADGFSVIGLTLRTTDRDRLALGVEEAFPTFTIAKASREWDKALWKPFREPVPFKAPIPDAVQDALAVAFGALTPEARSFNQWQRERAPLNFADGKKHVVIIDCAQNLPEERLHGVLHEARRHGALVIACGDAERGRRWFASLCPPPKPERMRAAEFESLLWELQRRNELNAGPFRITVK